MVVITAAYEPQPVMSDVRKQLCVAKGTRGNLYKQGPKRRNKREVAEEMNSPNHAYVAQQVKQIGGRRAAAGRTARGNVQRCLFQKAKPAKKITPGRRVLLTHGRHYTSSTTAIGVKCRSVRRVITEEYAQPCRKRTLYRSRHHNARESNVAPECTGAANRRNAQALSAGGAVKEATNEKRLLGRVGCGRKRRQKARTGENRVVIAEGSRR